MDTRLCAALGAKRAGIILNAGGARAIGPLRQTVMGVGDAGKPPPTRCPVLSPVGPDALVLVGQP